MRVVEGFKFGKPTIASIPIIVRSYKAAVTRRIGREYNTAGIWQGNYYEHIIRSEREMNNIRSCIESNPDRWDKDNENPSYKHR